MDKRFKEFPINASILTKTDIKKLKAEENLYKRNILLKELIKIRAKQSYDDMPLNFWIINKWGRIKNFKSNDTNKNKILKLQVQLHNEKMTKDVFETISSLSKLPAFIEPDKYVIYDSRVI